MFVTSASTSQHRLVNQTERIKRNTKKNSESLELVKKKLKP